MTVTELYTFLKDIPGDVEVELGNTFEDDTTSINEVHVVYNPNDEMTVTSLILKQ